jgi:hypothetical protein
VNADTIFQIMIRVSISIGIFVDLGGTMTGVFVLAATAAGEVDLDETPVWSTNRENIELVSDKRPPSAVTASAQCGLKTTLVMEYYSKISWTKKTARSNQDQSLTFTLKRNSR